jgi:hypothetical protein
MGERELSFQEGNRKFVEGRRRTENLEGFKLRKILEELAQNSARSVEEGQE